MTIYQHNVFQTAYTWVDVKMTITMLDPPVNVTQYQCGQNTFTVTTPQALSGEIDITTVTGMPWYTV